MPDIVDPQAVKFSNEQARVLADSMGSSYKEMKTLLVQWQAKNLAALFPNDGSVVVDGSATDGRTPITGADVNALVGLAQTLVASLEANNFAALNQIAKIAVNP